MIAINLSGIKSMNIPPSLFDEFFEKRSQFANAKYPEGTDIIVDVIWEEGNRFQEHGRALLCKIDNCSIGYIPILKTIEGYMDKARRENDLKKYEWHKERKAYTKHIRDYIETDLFRNDGTCRGVLWRVVIEDGAVWSVSVAFDDM